MSRAETLRIVVAISGRGSNLKALLDAVATGRLAARVVGVLSDRADAAGLEIARAAGVPVASLDRKTYASREDFEGALDRQLREWQCQLWVLAGFMRVLGAELVQAWRGRLINIHPSLLPRHRGLHTHARALEAGDAEHGASVHLVTPELDGGPVLMQVRMPIAADDTPESLAMRLLPLEHQLLVAAVEACARHRIELDDTGALLVDGERLLQPLILDAA